MEPKPYDQSNGARASHELSMMIAGANNDLRAYTENQIQALQLAQRLSVINEPVFIVENTVPIDKGRFQKVIRFVGAHVYGLHLTDVFEQRAGRLPDQKSTAVDEFKTDVAGTVKKDRDYYDKVISKNKLGMGLREIANTRGMIEKYGLGALYAFNFEQFRVDASVGPNDATDSVFLSCMFFDLSQMSQTDVHQARLRGSHVEKTSASYVMPLVDSLRSLRTQIRKTVFDKEAEGHNDLREAVIAGMDENDMYNYFATCYLSDHAPFKVLFRDAQEALQKTGDEALYGGIKGMILRSIDVGEMIVPLLRGDDAEGLFIGNKEVNTDFAEDHLEMINKIISRVSQKEFVIDPADLEWEAFQQLPTEIKLTISKDKPSQYEFSITVVDGNGDEKEIIVEIDAKTHQFDWNILEAPDSLPELRQRLFNTAGLLLEHAEEVSYTTQNARKRNLETVKPLGKKRKINRKSHKGSGVHQKKAPQELFVNTLAEVGEVQKRTIDVPAPDDLKDLLKGFSSTNQEKIIEGIKNFNERGVGKFKLLASRDKTREHLFSLRVPRESGGGGIRIVMRELPSSGDRNFQIVDIELRNGMYDRDNWWI